jgi:hypothetical protein
MTDRGEKRSAPIGIRVTPSVKAAAERAAGADHRTLASLIERLLIEHLNKTGFLKTPPAGKGNKGLPEGHSADWSNAGK